MNSKKKKKTFLVLFLLLALLATTTIAQQQQLSKCEKFFKQQCIPATVLPGPIFGECEENQIKCCKQLQQGDDEQLQCDAIRELVKSMIDLQLEMGKRPWKAEQVFQLLEAMCEDQALPHCF